jgi:hypothetical protein
MLHSFFDGFKDETSLDEALDTLIDKIAVKTEKCGLKHAPKEYNIEQPQAVDYLCQNLGYNKTGETTEVIRIPICEECCRGMRDPDWAVIYCVNCCNSQWIYKPKSSYEFHTDVVWLDECPHCTEEKKE